MLVVVAANTYLFSIGAAVPLKIVHYRDNLIPKLLFWPALLLSMIIITAYVLWVVGPTQERSLHECADSAGPASAYQQGAPESRSMAGTGVVTKLLQQYGRRDDVTGSI